MMGLGGPEIMIIVILALVLFGGKKLPEVGRMVGQTMREFRKVMREFTDVTNFEDFK